MSSVDPAGQAVAAADAAARRAGVRVERLLDVASIHEASRLFNHVWSTPANQPLISGATLRALSHSDNYVVGAYEGSEMVGAAVGFMGFHMGTLHLHSHMTGVSPKLQGRSVGFALKQHQRAWALSRGIKVVMWTFDPLVRRNAYFNISKLGASITEFYESFYGEMSDGINERDETDRVLSEWNLGSPHATEASIRRVPDPDVASLEGSGAKVALTIGESGAPVEHPVESDVVLVQVPEDIVELRHRDEDLAHEWRLALRHVLRATLNAGYVTTGMSRSGFYVLRREA
jgi:predicted GNAT superfamily acetyltransferase